MMQPFSFPADPTMRLTILAVAARFMVLEYLLSRLAHHDQVIEIPDRA
jgi:hypothetical protein